MAFHIRPLTRQNTVYHDVAHAAVAARSEVANDAVLLRAQRFNRALRPKVEVVGPEPHDFTTQLLKRVRQEQQLACRVDVGALAALAVPGVSDLDAIDRRRNVVVARRSDDRAAGQVAHDPGKHVAVALACERICHVRPHRVGRRDRNEPKLPQPAITRRGAERVAVLLGQGLQANAMTFEDHRLWRLHYGMRSLSQDFDYYPFLPLSIPLTIKHPLPRPEVELSCGDRHDDLVPDREAAQVSRGVVLARLVVPIPLGIPGRDRPLQPLQDVFPQSRLVVIHENGCGDVHGTDECQTFTHRADLHLLHHFLGDVDDLLTPLRVEPQIMGMALHPASGDRVDLSQPDRFPRLAANMALPFRRRIFVILVVMTAVPTVLAVAGWVLSVRRLLPAAGARAATERVAVTARTLLDGVDTLHLTVHERALLRDHLSEVSASVSFARRAETFLRYYTAGFALIIVLLGAAVLYAAVNLAGHLSRQLSRPIDELVGWTQLIRRHEPLPGGPPSRGAPEFEALRQALRELAAALAAARERELEAERLRAFREVARRVAHEIKNPLTSMRIAVDQLRRSGGPADRRTEVAVEVMDAETERLDQLAKEFAEFGRLPEGPKSEVDLVDLLMDLGQSAVPSEVDVSVRANGEPCKLLGHYDPLRRAFANLLRNASEAMGGRGSIEIAVTRDGNGLAVTIADHGAGIPDDLRQRVFEPYFTTKNDGTGLGLALVRQTIEAHNGSITVAETPGGGATFSIVLSAA